MFYREYQQRDNEEKRPKETGKGKRERQRADIKREN